MSENETSVTALGMAPCEKPARYIQQLVKHWGHKMATSYDADNNGGTGVFPFDDHNNAVMMVLPEGIAITLTTGEQERNIQLRGVIERHLDRFAFREAPLNYEWKEAEEA